MTEHEKLEAEIPALAAGRLPEPEATALAAHVATCASCSAVLAMAREIAALAEHPGVDDLRRYARGPKPPDAGAIEAHLTACASCSLEIAAWRKRTRRPRVVVLRAVLAVAAVVLIGLWLGPLLRRSAPARLSDEPPQSLVFSSALRSSTEEQVIDLEPGGDLLVRAEWESLEPLHEVGPLRLEIVAAGGPVWSVSLDADQVKNVLSAGTGVVAVVPAGTLENGSYEFRMLRLARPQEPPLVQERFRVQTAARHP